MAPSRLWPGRANFKNTPIQPRTISTFSMNARERITLIKIKRGRMLRAGTPSQRKRGWRARYTNRADPGRLLQAGGPVIRRSVFLRLDYCERSEEHTSELHSPYV